MTAIQRQSAKIFAYDAPVSQVTVFRTTNETTPSYSKMPDDIQNENFGLGWLNSDGGGNVIPYAEDMNAVMYTLSYNTAYLYEKGIPEYSSAQTYYINSFCQYQGTIYRCKVDETLNFPPTDTSKWDVIPMSAYSATTIGAGDGTFYAGMSGTQFQFKSVVAGDNITITESADNDALIISGIAQAASFTANSPLSYSGGVLTIQSASSSTDGYLTAADWTSFNSKLSSTIFSSDNTWTGANSFVDASITTISSLGTLVSPYDYQGGASKIALSYNPPVLNGSVTQWGWLGYLSSTEIGIFPSTNNTCNIGGANNFWKEGYISKITTAPGNGQGIHFGSYTYVCDVTNNTLVCHATSSIQFHVNSIPKVHVHTTGLRPSYAPSATVTNDLGLANYRWSTVYYTTLNPTSDARLKNNIEPLESGLNIINDLDIKSFTYINNPDHIEYGILAQNIVDKHPELISIPHSEDEYYGIYLHNFVFVATRAIQELSAKVNSLEQQLKEIHIR